MPVAIPWKKLLPLLALAGAPMLLGSAGLNDNLDQRVLAAHNRERIATGIPALVWDEGLAQSARAYAAKMSATGEFKRYPINRQRLLLFAKRDCERVGDMCAKHLAALI